MANLAVVLGPLAVTATSANPIWVEIAEHFGLKIHSGPWLVASSVPTLAAIPPRPPVLYLLLPPGVPRDTRRDHRGPRSPAVALAPCVASEIVSVAFAVMVTGWDHGRGR